MFATRLARLLNSGQTRTVLLHGEVQDLFAADGETVFEPLLPFLTGRFAVPGVVQIVYELNGPIRLVGGSQWEVLRRGWVAWKRGTTTDANILQSLVDRKQQLQTEMLERDFDANVADATGKPTVALEFLRQLTLCSRSRDPNGNAYIPEKLLIFIEAADMLLPAGEITRLSAADRHRVAVCADWFSDAGFMNGDDSVVLIAESVGGIHERVARLPAVLSVAVPAPDVEQRRRFIDAFDQPFETDIDNLAEATAGLSIHALRQLLMSAAHGGHAITAGDVIGKVEEYLAAKLGDDVVEFKKPSHSLDAVIGFTRLKKFLKDELLPRFRSDGPDALPGAAVAGPIGSGKTFIFEAVAAECRLPVLVLKNIRSQWFGQTDVLLERLRLVLESLDKVIIFVDEADTAFGAIGPEGHATERRLTGKIQQMMSDPRLRGKVTWLLMTARIHLLSPDIRRPGRVGDLIIPILDPAGDDRLAFVEWMLDGVIDGELEAAAAEIEPKLAADSAAAFASLRSNLKARVVAKGRKLGVDEVEHFAADFIPPAIGDTRRYQLLQALINCTRRSLLPEDVTEEDRARWAEEARALELRGIR
ncbi:MAG: ATP-binding protein [Planctomycetota bacterium]